MLNNWNFLDLNHQTILQLLETLQPHDQEDFK
jgi:hypothetical protein